MKTKNIIRIFYIIPVSSILTLLAFAYRYMWFTIDTIPAERVSVALLVAFMSSFLFINELS